jgi:disulfide bond formation protein DsbB
MNVGLFNNILSLGAVGFQIVALFLLASLLFARQNPIIIFAAKHAVALVFVVALLATLGSLTYSEIIGYEPCKLCWVQRIFMYPLVVLFGMALLKKTKEVLDYGIVLSLLGAGVAAFHYYEQISQTTLVSCGVGAVSCAQRLVMNFQYVTIPMMALSAFLVIFLLLVAAKKIKY